MKNLGLLAPAKPGCYLMKDKDNSILYVGKAKQLKSRVSSYFTGAHDDKTTELIRHIASVDFVTTRNETEALLLEASLVREHQPPFNILLKEAERYAWIELTQEEYPRLRTARKKTKNGIFFGPFTSGADRQNVLRTLNHAFKLRTCNKLPKRACLKYHIGLCSAPCINKISKEDYEVSVSRAQEVLKGSIGPILKKVEGEMQVFSDSEHYELAKERRDQLLSLNSLQERQAVSTNKKYDQDVVAFESDEEEARALVFNVHHGTIINKRAFSFPNREYALEEFLIRYYTTNAVPKEILTPFSVDEALPLALSQHAKKKVLLSVPQRGEKKNLLDLALQNLPITFKNHTAELQDLRIMLGFEELPLVIETFDISHTSGTSVTASMVQFQNGEPNKEAYRRFKIKGGYGNDDYASMQEVVRRRYSKLRAEKKSMPDLIVIDGGKGQLSSALEILKKLELKIPIVGLAKKEEELYFPGLDFPKKFDTKRPGMKLIIQTRNEAHRFALKYHRLLRSKEALK